MEIITGPVSAPLQHLAASVTAPPDAAATQRFATLMQPSAAVGVAGDVAGVTAAGAPAAGVHATDQAAASVPVSVGDRILDGLNNVSKEFRSNWNQVSDMLRTGGPELTPQALLSMQFHMANTIFQTEFLSKNATQAPRTIDQLVRVQ